MILEITIPSPGESITEVELTAWLVQDGSWVAKNQEIGEVESEKATLPLIAGKSGELKILVDEGETVEVGKVVASIDTSVEAPAGRPEESSEAKLEVKEEAKAAAQEKVNKVVEKAPAKTASTAKATPLAREIMEKEGLSVDDVLNGLRKISAGDVKRVLQNRDAIPANTMEVPATRDEERIKMSQLRKKISQRLVAVKNETAMLTTFNEADMSAIIRIRKQYQEAFTETYGIKLGFMSFFTKAVTEALRAFPAVNSRIEDEEVVSPSYCDIGIAVQTDKGLMVPVLRNTESLNLAMIEQEIADLAARARKARLTMEEMTGGTFSISNGGIYGSMLSTPILNPPQSGILGMHNILERPIAINGKVEVRPMMYLALSYDHRVIDGKDSVGFLKMVKELLEEPAKLIRGSKDEEELLLGI